MQKLTYATVKNRRFSKRTKADTIYVDVTYGITVTDRWAQIAVDVEDRADPLLNISFSDGPMWSGSVPDLKERLRGKPAPPTDFDTIRAALKAMDVPHTVDTQMDGTSVIILTSGAPLTDPDELPLGRSFVFEADGSIIKPINP